MNTLRTCKDCGARYEIREDVDRDTCRRCAGLRCPGCGGPTQKGVYCRRPPGQIHPGCQAISDDHIEALVEESRRERLRREAERPTLRRVG